MKKKIKQMLQVSLATSLIMILFYIFYISWRAIFDVGKHYNNEWDWSAGASFLFVCIFLALMMGIVGIIAIINDRSDEIKLKRKEKSATELYEAQQNNQSVNN